MDPIKYFFNMHVPVSTCNLRCHYCYITQSGAFSNKLPIFNHTYDFIGKAYSIDRLGGVCHFNFCGDGETLLPGDVIGIVKAILEQGHTVFIVTNGTMTNRFSDITGTFPKDLLSRLGFKFSFHYLELVRLNLIDVFFKNVQMVRDAGCSFSVEVTPTDELIPYIDDIKRLCCNHVGAICHITVARNEKQKQMPILTNLDIGSYKKIWGQFESPMFEYKLSTFNVKRKEFCYAGLWSSVVNVYNGNLVPCYGYGVVSNIYLNIKKPIRVRPVGYSCKMPHCFNSHAFLTLGNIPELKAPLYSVIRDRTTYDGKQWLTREMLVALSSKLVESNDLLSEKQKKIWNIEKRILYFPLLIKSLYLRVLGKLNVIK